MPGGDRTSKQQSVDLRERAARLRADGLDYAAIGAALDVSPIKARDLARQHQRERERIRDLKSPPELSRRAAANLLVGKYGAKVAVDLVKRAARLTEIACAYTWNELLAEEDIGPKTAAKIRRWLEAQGLTLREPGTSVTVARKRARELIGPLKAQTAPKVQEQTQTQAAGEAAAAGRTRRLRETRKSWQRIKRPSRFALRATR